MKRIILPSLIISMLILMACGGREEPTPTPSPTDTPIPTATPAPTSTPVPTPEPTATEAKADEPEVVQAETDESETIEVVMNDLYFGESNDNQENPPVWTVTSGAEVTVEMENLSKALQHNWAIAKPGQEVPEPFVGGEQMEVVLLDAGVLDAGQSATFAFTSPEPGEYTIICTVAGHYPVMQGKLVVTE